MATYIVHNNQSGTIEITDSSGNLQTIPAGGSLTVGLDSGGYAKALSLFGTANVAVTPATPTYVYATAGLAPVATPTDVIVIQGSATKTVNITRIRIGGAATAQGAMLAQLIRRSTAGTLGSAVLTAITPCYDDINNGANTAVVSTVGTANYGTLGTSAGVLGVQRFGMPALSGGTAGDAQSVEWVWEVADQPVRLRGTSDFLCINLNGSALPSGGVIDVEIETFEDNS